MTQAANFLENEKKRLSKVKQLMLLDAPSEPLFHEICKLASKVCGTPTALVSLIDETHQFIKASVGHGYLTEIPTDIAFCAKVILEDDLLEVTDATQDIRFKNNPLVTHYPHIRFYAGVRFSFPDAHNMGVLCVVDSTPNALTPNQQATLKSLANVITQALLLRENSLHEIQNKASNLAAIVEHSEDAIIGKTLDGFVTSWNDGAEKIFGYAADEMIGQHISKIFPEDKIAEEAVFIQKIKNNQKIKHYQTERITKKGKRIDVSISLSPIKNAIGEIIGAAKIGRDISTQKRLQDKIAEQKERLKITMDSIGDAVITTDNLGLVQYLNPVAEDLTGWTKAEAFGQPLKEVFNIVNAATRKPCLNPVELCLNENRIVGLANHTVLINRNNIEFGIEDSAAPIRDQSGKTIGIVLVFHDVTSQREMANEISYRATHDGLTGLYNRTEFEARLKKYIKNKRDPNAGNAVLFVDLDRFKVINDTCGHHAGDTVLKEISKIMQGCVRNSDMTARIGGDEFAIILAKCNSEKALQIANMICKSIDEYRFLFNEQRFQIGASIGMVMIDHHWISISELIQAADNACLEAKRTGRNRVHLHFHDDQSLEAHKDAVHWATRITQAIEDNGFELFAQRIVPLNSYQLEHAEILVRLKSKSGELIPPNAFLPAAERFHIISSIDRWVLKTVLNWLYENAEALNHFEAISINLSGQSLVDLTFHDFAKRLIDSIPNDYKKICFEITETAAITNILDAKKFISAMKQYGIKFSLDDFGSGASSFGYLNNLSVDYLKIDGQFIKDLPDNKIGQATVKCITEVAKITHTQTIAEWVDNTTVENILKDMGVDFVQGYLKHKPAPIDCLLEKNIDSVAEA